MKMLVLDHKEEAYVSIPRDSNVKLEDVSCKGPPGRRLILIKVT